MWHVARGTVVGPRCRVYIYHIVLLPLVVYTPHGCAIARALKQIFAQVKIFLEGTLVRNWILLVLHRAHFLTIVAPVRKKGGPNPSCSVRAMRAKTSVAELARCGYVRERSSPRNNGKRRRIIDCSLGTHEDNGHGGEAWRTAGFSIARVISDFPLRSGLSCSCRTFPLQDSFINNDRREFPREMLIFVAACFLCLFLLLRARDALWGRVTAADSSFRPSAAFLFARWPSSQLHLRGQKEAAASAFKQVLLRGGSSQ